MLSWGYKLFCEFKVHDHVLDEKWEFFASLSIYHHQVIKVQVRHWKATWYSLIEDVWPPFFAVQDFGVFQCFMGPNGKGGPKYVLRRMRKERFNNWYKRSNIAQYILQEACGLNTRVPIMHVFMHFKCNYCGLFSCMSDNNSCYCKSVVQTKKLKQYRFLL